MVRKPPPSPMPSPSPPPPPPAASRLALSRLQASTAAGVILGALLGLADAVVVWRFHPSNPAARGARAFAALVTPGPMWRVTPIFLTAPLANMVLLGAAGTVLGWARSRSARPRAERLASEVSRDALALLLVLVWAFVLGLGAALARSSRTPGLILCAALAAAAALWGVYRLLAWLLDLLLASRIARLVRGHTPWRKLLASVALLDLAVATIPPAFAPPASPPKLAASVRMAAAPSRPAPNIVLLVIDTARADRFSSYGYPLSTTPEMDRLAARGLLFERAIAPAAWTVPAHASLLTGAPLCVHGADAMRPFLGAELATLPEMLAEHGYRTGGFSNNPLFSRITGMTRGFERFEDHWRADGPAPLSIYQRPAELILAKWKRGKVHGGADVTLPRVLEWIDEERGADASPPEATQRPFFAFVNLMEPHVHLTYHPGITDRFRDPNDTVDDLLRTPQTAFQLVHEHEELRKDDARRYGALYDGELAFADAAIGDFVRELERRGLAANTLLVITADHGEAIGEHETFSHGQTVHDEVTRVPLIVLESGRVPAGVRVRTPVSTAEIVPTLLAAAGVATPRVEAPGGASAPRNLLAVSLEPRAVVAEVESMEKMIGVVRKVDADAASTAARKSGHKAIYDGSLKYIARGDGVRQLFDLDADPAELTNLASARPAEVERLEAVLAAWRHDAGCDGGVPRAASAGGELTLDPDAERALRSLGYVR